MQWTRKYIFLQTFFNILHSLPPSSFNNPRQVHRSRQPLMVWKAEHTAPGRHCSHCLPHHMSGTPWSCAGDKLCSYMQWPQHRYPLFSDKENWNLQMLRKLSQITNLGSSRGQTQRRIYLTKSSTTSLRRTDQRSLSVGAGGAGWEAAGRGGSSNYSRVAFGCLNVNSRKNILTNSRGCSDNNSLYIQTCEMAFAHDSGAPFFYQNTS